MATKGVVSAHFGTDISGVVEVIADDVKDFSVGDEVYSTVRFPSELAGGSRAYAEYVNVAVSELALKPKYIDHVHAAGAPMFLLTAWWFMVDLGHNGPNPHQKKQHKPVPLEGRTVLVNAATGGVGHFAVQLAKWKGARVIAVASGKKSPFHSVQQVTWPFVICREPCPFRPADFG